MNLATVVITSIACFLGAFARNEDLTNMGSLETVFTSNAVSAYDTCTFRNDNYMLSADSNIYKLVGGGGTTQQILVSGATSPRFCSVAENFLYYTEDSSGKIYRAQLDASSIPVAPSHIIGLGISGASCNLASGLLVNMKTTVGKLIFVPERNTLYIAATDCHAILQTSLASSWTVTTAAGQLSVNAADDNAVATSGTMQEPYSMALSPGTLNIYFMARTNEAVVRRFTIDGSLTTVAGKLFIGGYLAGFGTSATLSFNPVSMTVLDEHLFIVDISYNAVWACSLNSMYCTPVIGGYPTRLSGAAQDGGPGVGRTLSPTSLSSVNGNLWMPDSTGMRAILLPTDTMTKTITESEPATKSPVEALGNGLSKTKSASVLPTQTLGKSVSQELATSTTTTTTQASTTTTTVLATTTQTTTSTLPPTAASTTVTSAATSINGGLGNTAVPPFGQVISVASNGTTTTTTVRFLASDIGVVLGTSSPNVFVAGPWVGDTTSGSPGDPSSSPQVQGITYLVSTDASDSASGSSSWTPVVALPGTLDGEWQVSSNSTGDYIDVNIICTGDNYCGWGFVPDATSENPTGTGGLFVVCYSNGSTTSVCSYLDGRSTASGGATSDTVGTTASPGSITTSSADIEDQPNAALVAVFPVDENSVVYCMDPFFFGLIVFIVLMIAMIIFKFLREGDECDNNEVKVDTWMDINEGRSVFLHHSWIQAVIPCHSACAVSHGLIWGSHFFTLLMLIVMVGRFTFDDAKTIGWVALILFCFIPPIVVGLLKPVFTYCYWYWRFEEESSESGLEDGSWVTSLEKINADDRDEEFSSSDGTVFNPLGQTHRSSRHHSSAHRSRISLADGTVKGAESDSPNDDYLPESFSDDGRAEEAHPTTQPSQMLSPDREGSDQLEAATDPAQLSQVSDEGPAKEPRQDNTGHDSDSESVPDGVREAVNAGGEAHEESWGPRIKVPWRTRGHIINVVFIVLTFIIGLVLNATGSHAAIFGVSWCDHFLRCFLTSLIIDIFVVQLVAVVVAYLLILRKRKGHRRGELHPYGGERRPMSSKQ